ncbi:MAG: 4-oxalocrotonate tautomerase family protein [Paracoccaceae bacterium]
MAIVSVTIIEGRPAEVKHELMAKLTNVVVDVLGAEPRQVRVVINEVKDGDYAVGGQPVILHGAGHG